jgi:hypothetical protein
VGCGQGKMQRSLALFPQVIVNKHLLGDDPGTWPRPKNYRLKRERKGMCFVQRRLRVFRGARTISA